MEFIKGELYKVRFKNPRYPYDHGSWSLVCYFGNGEFGLLGYTYTIDDISEFINEAQKIIVDPVSGFLKSEDK